MKKTKLTRSLLAACSIVALTAVMYGCVHDGDDPPATDGMPTAEEQIADLQGQINALRTQLGLAADDNLSDSITDLQSQITSLTAQLKAKQDAEDEAADMAKRAKLGKLATAIGAVDFATDPVAHVQAADARAKPTTAVDGDAPHAISGWNGASYSNTVAGATTMTTVYNDKAPDTSSTFNKRFTIVTGGTDQQNGKVFSLGWRQCQADRRVSRTCPRIPATMASRSGLRMACGEPWPEHPGPSLAIRDPSRVSVDSDGNPTWTGALLFKPDSATASVMMPDTSYMNLGWWLSMDTDGEIDGVTVAAWATGDPYTTTNLAALVGKATFEGIAVGKYTHKTINSISGGHFNADAMLVADWGDGTAEGTLRGTIDNFMQDGESFGSDWKVELSAARTGDGTTASPYVFNPMMGAPIASGGDTVANTDNGARGTFGTQVTWGTWNAAFVDDSRNDTMPGGVTGTFHVGQTAHPINMVGAFAASNQETDLPE